MRKLQSQGVHHITIVGAGRQTSNEDRDAHATRTPTDPGCVQDPY